MPAICVVEVEGDEEIVELPLEENGSLLVSTLQGQFYGAMGLKYRNPDNKAFRGARLADNVLYPFDANEGWKDHIYICVFPKENKRKCDEHLENATKTKKTSENKFIATTDLIVLGLPYKTTEAIMKEYFDTFGELLVCTIKKDKETGQSKGYGFVRFSKYEVQVKVLARRHLIDERWCMVRIPTSKDPSQKQNSNKIYVGRITEHITAEDLSEYFNKFGEVTEVFIPMPFRAFAFVSFFDPQTAQSLFGEDHLIKGNSVVISSASPKMPKQKQVPSSGDYRGRNDVNAAWASNYQGNGSGNRYDDNNASRSKDNFLNSSMSTSYNSFGYNNNRNDNNGGNINPNQFPPLNPALIAAALTQWSLQMTNNSQNNQP